MIKALVIGLAVGTTTYGGIFATPTALAMNNVEASGVATVGQGELWDQRPNYFFRSQELGLGEGDAVSSGALFLTDATELVDRTAAQQSVPAPESGDLSLGLPPAPEAESSYGDFDHIFVTPLHAPLPVPEPTSAALIALGAGIIAQRRKRN